MNKLFRDTLSFLLLSAILLWSAESMVFASQFYTNKNKFISYTDIGHGKPLVLIHAFPTDHQLWEPQQEGLKENFRVITLDLWGFGKSSPTDAEAITMTDYADEVKQLMGQLGIQKAIIGGESMGGYIALAFLDKYPDNVNGLLLSDTQSIADSLETKVKREATAIDVLEHGTVNFIHTFMTKALSPKASEQQKIILQQILETQKSNAIASASRGMALRHDTSDLLANSTLPILILTGNDDTLISPEQSKNMHALAKNSQLVILMDAGHLASLEQPEKWNEAVISMFSNISNEN